MHIEEISFINNRNARLAGRIYRPDNAGPGGDGVIFCHGLFSSKDAYKIIRMADSITGAGFSLLTFDFSFAMGGDFSRFSILQEVEDLKSAFRHFLGTGIKSVHLIGSSMGGVVALLFASVGHRFLRSLSLIATPVKLDELSRSLAGGIDSSILPADGMTLIEGVEVHNAFFRETASIDMKKAIGSIGVPVLVLHGANDTVVDISNAHLLDASLGPPHAVIVIADGEHNLTREADIAILGENIIGWMKKHAA